MASSFHVCAYGLLEAASQANVDMTALTDPVISSRNGHFIFSEQYRILWMMASGLHINNLRSNIPTWNSMGRHRVWPLDVSANANRANNYPRIQDMRDIPLQLPINEEVAFEASTTSSGATSAAMTLLMALAPTIAWNRNLPQQGDRFVEQATFTASASARTWSGPSALTFADNLRGGWYVVNAAYCTPATTSDPAIAFRLFFPRSQLVAPDGGGGGRILRPGGYVTDQIGNLEVPDLNVGMGEWGRFHTFEPPQAEILTINNAPSGIVYTLRLDLTYLGTTPLY